jgi:hypothetical protein
MVDRYRVIFEWTRFGRQFSPAGCTVQLGGSIEVGHQDSCGQARHLLTQCLHALPYVERLSAVAVAVDCDEDRRFQLREPMPHGTCPEVRGARRPRRTQAGDGEEGSNRFDAVGQEGDHPVAGAHAEQT